MGLCCVHPELMDRWDFLLSDRLGGQAVKYPFKGALRVFRYVVLFRVIHGCLWPSAFEFRCCAS